MMALMGGLLEYIIMRSLYTICAESSNIYSKETKQNLEVAEAILKKAEGKRLNS